MFGREPNGFFIKLTNKGHLYLGVSMATQYKLDAVLRTDAGKGASRRLRRTGKIPAIVYGGDRRACIYLLGREPASA